MGVRREQLRGDDLEVAAKALMIKCGASEGSLRIDRKAFLQAAAADDARIAKAKAKKSLEA